MERCSDPYATRRRAELGLDVPCNTGCLAYTGRSCALVDAKTKREPSRRPARDDEQTTLW
jgi:hypothetical protein